MSTRNLVIVAIKIFSLLVLFQTNEVFSADYASLLSRLYKRASDADRPLIVIFDSNFLKSERDSYDRPSLFDAIRYNEYSENRGSHSKTTKKPRDSFIHKKRYNFEKKLHHALAPIEKRLIRQKQMLRSPIIRNLLRISNTLNCQAKDECVDRCKYRFGRTNDNNNDNCLDKCENKFDCEEEPAESACDDCETNSCENDDCGGPGEGHGQGSTKGYTSTDPSVGCREC